MPERAQQTSETARQADIITIGGTAYRPGQVGHLLAQELMRLTGTVKRVEALADEWESDHGILSPDSRYTRDVLVRELRGALSSPGRSGGTDIWEQVSYDEDGDVGRAIRYAVPTDNFSLSSGLGLLEASREYVRRDILGERGNDE